MPIFSVPIYMLAHIIYTFIIIHRISLYIIHISIYMVHFTSRQQLRVEIGTKKIVVWSSFVEKLFRPPLGKVGG